MRLHELNCYMPLYKTEDHLKHVKETSFKLESGIQKLTENKPGLIKNKKIN